MDFKDATVLVTGGTGSFGNRFTQIMLDEYHPKKLIIFSRDELKQYEMEQRFQNDSLRFFIGDVRDQSRLHRALDDVDYVVHAAALKQVPAAEYNPFEAVSTNIIGAENVINEAIDHNVKRVIALSTDKRQKLTDQAPAGTAFLELIESEDQDDRELIGISRPKTEKER